MSEPFIHPDWPAPPNVRALATTRQGGCSQGPFASLNLAMHVEDDPDSVRRNREWLREAAQLPSEPIWLQQVHGTGVWSGGAASPPPVADAAVTRTPGEVCAILTADCLPVLLCDTAGSVVGAAHAGWRGLAGGVLQATIAAMKVPAAELIAWLGPAIEPDAFEVGPEVLEQFVARHSEAASAFTPNSRGRWQADLYALARIELAALGVSRIYGGGFATVADAERFFSYRRDRRTGRMATLIWFA
jgi:YfiH family protein